MSLRGGYSWKRAVGITNAKRKIARATGVPLTRSGRQRKIGKAVTGGCSGCLVKALLFVSFMLLLLSLLLF